MANLEPDVIEKIRTANQKNYVSQAIFFLNACFHNLSDADKEEVFQLTMQFAKEDHVKGKEGNELNTTQAFHLLQGKGQAMTALEWKAKLRQVDIDANGEMALLEYAIFTFNQDATKVARAPQGSATPEEQQKLEAAEENMRKLGQLLDELTVAKAEAKKAEDDVRAVEAEARAIEAEIKAQEKAKQDEMARLDALTQDQSVGIVKRNMAVQQLATLKNEDSLPLQKAKLTQEATVRRLAKATEAAAAATAKAVQAAEDCLAAFKQAEADFEELKRTCSGIAHGQIFYMERDLKEKKKYLPQSRQ